MGPHGDMTLDQKIRNLRKHTNTSQGRLAEVCEVSQGLVSFWERGKHVPSAYHVAAMARLFGVPVNYLVDDADERNANELGDELAVRQAAAQLGWGVVYSRILANAAPAEGYVPEGVTYTRIDREPAPTPAIRRKGAG